MKYTVYYEVIESGHINIEAGSSDEARGIVMIEFGEDPHYALTIKEGTQDDGPTLNITHAEEEE